MSLPLLSSAANTSEYTPARERFVISNVPSLLLVPAKQVRNDVLFRIVQTQQELQWILGTKMRQDYCEELFGHLLESTVLSQRKCES